MMATTMGGNFECCMCGDYGLASELFRCKICQFRSQHRYCSNLYPRAETYRVCNWCLIEASRGDDRIKTSDSSTNSPSPCAAVDDPRHPNHGMKSRKKGKGSGGGGDGGHHLDHGQAGAMLKKQKSLPEGSGRITRTTSSVVVAAGKGRGDGTTILRKVDDDQEDERRRRMMIRRTKSEETANVNGTSVIMKQGCRGKVRRYKLLDDVSS
ncbi:hypothetical protein Dimus_006237 [Dionaea muscipula]